MAKTDDITDGPTMTRRAAIRHSLQHACALGGVGAVAGLASCREQATSQPQPADAGEEIQPQQEPAPLPKVASANYHPKLPLVLLITLDTTRADHLGCYGYSKPTTPNLDRFAQRSVVYERMIAPGTWTLPSHASLFTGKFIASHGVRKDPNGPLPLSDAITGQQAYQHARARPMSADEAPLAALLQSVGYQTGGVVAGPWMMRVFGMDRGFDFYDDSGIHDAGGRTAGDVTDRALEWLGESPGQPRFLFLNYFDAHTPYAPPAEFARKFAQSGDAPDSDAKSSPDTIGLYDAEIAYMDSQVGRLLDGLRELKLFDSALIVITSDHGELLGEHGTHFHGHIPYQEVVHIPMIVKEPGANGETGRRSEWIQLTDVLPMIFDRLELTLPPGIQGGLPPDVAHPIVMESYTLPRLPYYNGQWLAIIEDGMKMLWNDRGHHKLFDLNADPREEQNLFSSRPMEARAMSDAVHNYLASLPEPGALAPSSPVDRKTLRTLKSLGYVK